MAVAKQFSATVASIPAPIGGWNARDSLSEMNAMDAVQMINFYPTPTDVTLRKGYTKEATTITGEVQSLMNYTKGATYELFAFAGGDIYETKQDPAVKVYEDLSNSKWQHVNLTNDGGHYLSAVNGVDAALIYDGTNWIAVATTTTAQTISTITHVGAVATVTTAAPHGLSSGNQITVSGASPADYNGTFVITKINNTQFTYTMATTPASNATVVGAYTVNLAITGVNSNLFINVNLFKNRLYYVERDSMRFWYLDTNAIAGPAVSFDMGGIFRNGGYIQAIGTWTLDAGQGVDDYFVVVTSMGEVAVYVGSDITDPAGWELRGVWQLGQTFSRRCFFKWGGDLLLLTQDGLVPLAASLQSSRLDPRINLTDKIYYAISQAATQYYANFGWQINYFASENMLILNVPISGGTEQYVMHTITKSWARFTDIEAHCWEVSGDSDIHFGGNGYVGTFYNSFSDAGNNINGVVQQAYNYFDSRGQLKRFTMVRPILQTDNGVPTVLCGISTDFTPIDNLGRVSFNPSLVTRGVWDTSDWDQAQWGGVLVTTKIWQGVTGLGFSGSINMTVASQGIDFHWASTDYVMEKGGIL